MVAREHGSTNVRLRSTTFCGGTRQRGKGFSVALGDIAKLIDSGKEKAYLTYGEVNDLIPHDVNSSEVLDDLLTTIGTQGMDVLEGLPKLPSAREKGLENEVEASDEVQHDLTPDALEKTNDPVRIYLRAMGAIPLLTREGEVDIAKRIERGQLQVLRALSRSPVVIRQVLAIGKDLRHGIRSIRDIVGFDEEEVTEEILQNRVKDLTRRIGELKKHYERAGRLAERLPTIPSQQKAHQYSRCRYRLGREIVRISLIIRNLGLTNFERKQLIDRVNKIMDVMRSLDRQVSSLEEKIESTHEEELKKDYRKTQREHRVFHLCDVVDSPGSHRAIADQARTIRLPVHMVETVNKLIRVSRQLLQELGREPTSQEIAKRMDIPVTKLRNVRKIMQVPISLETPIGEEGNSHLGDFIEDSAVLAPDEAAINANLKEQTGQVLHTLTPREEKIMKMRFGLEDGLEHTLEEVGRSFAVTRERIRRSKPRLCANCATLHALASSGYFSTTCTNDAVGREVHAGRAQERDSAAAVSRPRPHHCDAVYSG